MRMGSLRDEQKRIARDRILEALSVEIVENGLLDLSVPAVAERAGVSQRTVYNHFANKEVLVNALGTWAEEWMDERGGRIVEPDVDLIPEAIEINFALFSEMGDLTAALARIRDSIDREHRFDATGSRDRRTENLRVGLAESRPDLDDRQLDAITAIFRNAFRFETWSFLANESGLSGEDAGTVAAWAYSVLFKALLDNQGPFDA